MKLIDLGYSLAFLAFKIFCVIFQFLDHTKKFFTRSVSIALERGFGIQLSFRIREVFEEYFGKI